LKSAIPTTSRRSNAMRSQHQRVAACSSSRRQRCADPEMLRPHHFADSDHRSASACNCCLGSASSSRVRDSLSDSDPCVHLTKIYFATELGIGHDVRRECRTGGIRNSGCNLAVKINRLVCLFVCLLPTLYKNFRTDLHEIFRADWQWATEQPVKFWWRSSSRIRIRIRIRIATLIRRALAEVCTVPVLVVNIISS